jgi:hypothetical protein
MAGDLEVDGDLQELLRLGIYLRYDRKNVSFWKKIQLLAHSLVTRNTVARTPKKHRASLRSRRRLLPTFS